MADLWHRVLGPGAWAGAALAMACCSTQAPAATPAASSSPPAQMAGTHGTVSFVSQRVGWVVAPHARRHNTDIYKSVDGGLTWTRWGSLSAPAELVKASDSAVILMPVDSSHQASQLEYSSDGSHWQERRLPFPLDGVPGVHGTQFLDDMRHGWITQEAYAGGPDDFSRTTDGGRTWTTLARLNYSNGGSTPFFWSATDGAMTLLEGKGSSLMRTSDGGGTWHEVQVPAVDLQKDLGLDGNVVRVEPESPVMFDGATGLLPRRLNPTDGRQNPGLNQVVYVSRTVDGGEHWSGSRLVRLPTAGGVTFLSDVRWVLSSQSSIYTTNDAGATWHRAEGLDPTLQRGYPVPASLAGSGGMVATLTYSVGDIEWMVMTTDAGTHWSPVPLPDIREAAELVV